ncbi:MAG: sigma-54 dependent transcriptional regulator [Gemmatimonadota bacterium]|nr:sigma-54 dependent transcriptional regulator [Gemmatimonadota bacterium]MDH4347472.1 sigma-54 dependent transcriptional regulator [Gemmatimonadota bacterium]MDH5283960.1 sigma-54 dependent transcriptional regulator [Gemmatimonadota bacterium]
MRAAGADPARQREWNATLREYHTADAAMQTCLDLASIAARTDLPVLILGETGTGKTLLARVIHNSSRRARNPFVAFNAAALSETLLDSQLFGHEKGAFTGADRRVKGKFELADGGTLFLDEIADMSPTAQAKILRAVEYGEFERLGSELLLEADVRLISATHLPIARYLQTDTFRKDLFYRISGITLRVPALRDRPNDLRTLMASEIATASAVQGKAIVGLSRAAADCLLAYHWPGNLRELRRVIDTAIAVTEGDVIELDALLMESGAGPDEEGRGKTALASAPLPEGDLSLTAAERRHILAVLEQCGNNKRRAARLLGLARSTLDRKLARH